MGRSDFKREEIVFPHRDLETPAVSTGSGNGAEGFIGGGVAADAFPTLGVSGQTEECRTEKQKYFFHL